MKSVIEISGLARKFEFMMFVGPEFQINEKVDSSTLGDYECFCSVDMSSFDCSYSLNAGSKTEVIFYTDSVWATIEPLCNVPFTITRSYTIPQWCTYSLIMLGRLAKYIYSGLKERRL